MRAGCAEAKISLFRPKREKRVPPLASKFFRSLHRGIAAALVLACFAVITPSAMAQEERPQIIPGERKFPQKKDAGPRAVAVLRMTDNHKTSLVPIAILINGKFWDATAYKADPVPMALDSGTVYEAERSGSSLGLFTVDSALHSNAPNSQAPWLGVGAWKPTGTDEPKPAAKADSAPVGIDTEDAPPRLTHDPAKPTPPASTAPASGTTPSSNAPPATTSKPSSDSDEPPRLSKPTSPTPSQQPSATPAAPGQSTPSQPGSKAPADQGDSKSSESKADNKANIPASDSGAGGANRPILRRGKPTESFADEDVPGYSRPGAGSSAPAVGGKIVEAAAAQADVKLIPAISDAGGPTPHPYTFEWIKGEEEDRRKQMVALAKQQVQAYAIAQDRAKITPTHPQPAKRATIKMKEPQLDNMQMIAYDLWNSNQPIIVFSAEAQMPPPAPGAPHSEVASDLQYSVMLVAYPDIYGNLRKLYSGVTDKFHLDITPKLELIDAVDADGDGRGELLFRATSDAGTGWVIYRATGDKLFKMFDSLNPQ